MPQDEVHYNHVHSCSRMVVERAFGVWKNTFRLFQVTLLHGTPEEMTLLIEATLVLHNWMIDEKEAALEAITIPSPSEYEDWMHIGGDVIYDSEKNQIDGVEAVITRDHIKAYITNYT
ncbi:hypothetical protein AaE_011465 [Aphanomyces astaci]|uniref:DDE Tnp4 domain-containing protein n=1 Tax=Aphanomyces astaci TaxID=112090 RepID=A0A6A4ZQH1_APHAT|nr:hypothetical protein AaE_011465 [Aphanomyces astaci]